VAPRSERSLGRSHRRRSRVPSLQVASPTFVGGEPHGRRNPVAGPENPGHRDARSRSHGPRTAIPRGTGADPWVALLESVCRRDRVTAERKSNLTGPIDGPRDRDPEGSPLHTLDPIAHGHASVGLREEVCGSHDSSPRATKSIPHAYNSSPHRCGTSPIADNDPIHRGLGSTFSGRMTRDGRAIESTLRAINPVISKRKTRSMGRCDRGRGTDRPRSWGHGTSIMACTGSLDPSLRIGPMGTQTSRSGPTDLDLWSM
jgi:hypothetical protein